MVLVDSGYGNNTSFLSQVEARNLKYLGGIAKNRKIKNVPQVLAHRCAYLNGLIGVQK